ncbi:hypothetical protein EMIT0210MI2_270012 [Priestia megaterium]|uniref:hypothetical protein n=1 Tax=Priestia megaterium TaxID=1404 RepID=UPI002E1E7E68|nr:hypothetical protein [Priestia megaterium]
MNLMNTVKTDVLTELKKGNTAVLKGLPPLVAMSYGLALQNEVGQIPESSINDEAVNNAMLKLIGKEKKVTG